MRFLVDFDLDSGRSAMPGMSTLARTLDIGSEDVAKKVKECIGGVAESLSSATADIPGFELGQVTFSLVINGTGELSIMSVVKAATSAQTGIQITLIPKRDNVS